MTGGAGAHSRAAACVPDPFGGSLPLPRNPRRAPARLLVVGVVLLVLLAGVVGLTRPAVVGSVRQDPATAAVSPRTADPLLQGLPDEVADPASRQAAVSRLLIDRGDAVRRDDEQSWLRGQLPGARVPRWSSLQALPLTQWSYAVDSLSSGSDPRLLTVGVTVTYRLDVDPGDAVVRERMTLRHDGSAWRVSEEATEGVRAEPWDLGELTALRGRRSLVIGIDQPASALRRWADLADSVSGDVGAVWREPWYGAPVLVVGTTTAQLGRGLGRTPQSLDRIAAVTTSESVAQPDSAPEPVAARVWTNTEVMGSLSALGRQIVLRHETLHVAAGAAATSATPLWLEEGLAEYVGYRGSGVPLRTAAGDVVQAVRDGRGPSALPRPADFSGPRLAEAYESAHVACAAFADRYGLDALVELYRLTATGRGDAQANLEQAARQLTGQGTAAIQALWRARLRALAG